MVNPDTAGGLAYSPANGKVYAISALNPNVPGAASDTVSVISG